MKKETLTVERHESSLQASSNLSMSYSSEIGRIDALLQEGEFEKVRERIFKLRIDFPNSSEFDQIEEYMNKVDALADDY
jgi:hypothetical protein